MATDFKTEPKVPIDVIGRAWKLLYRELYIAVLGNVATWLVILGTSYLSLIAQTLVFDKTTFESQEKPAVYWVFNVGSTLLVTFLTAMAWVPFTSLILDMVRKRPPSLKTAFSHRRAILRIGLVSAIVNLPPLIIHLCSWWYRMPIPTTRKHFEFLDLFVGVVSDLAPGLVVALFAPLLLAPYFILERDLGVLSSFRASWRAIRPHYWTSVLIILLATFLTWAGALVCGVGLLFTGPLVHFVTGMMYADCQPVPMPLGNLESEQAPGNLEP